MSSKSPKNLAAVLFLVAGVLGFSAPAKAEPFRRDLSPEQSEKFVDFFYSYSVSHIWQIDTPNGAQRGWVVAKVVCGQDSCDFLDWDGKRVSIMEVSEAADVQALISVIGTQGGAPVVQGIHCTETRVFTPRHRITACSVSAME